MNMKWKKTMTSVLLSASLVASTSAVTVYAKQAPVVKEQAQAASLKLSNNVQVEFKGAFIEKTANGTAIGAVIRLKNTSGKITRVPDYELRATSSDGISYTLLPSGTNARAIQPKGKVELTYLIQVNRTDSFTLKKLNWVYVDEYVYPRKEKTLLSMNVTGKVWQGVESLASATKSLTAWGKPFKLDLYSPNVTYTPTNLSRQNTDKGVVTIVTVKAVNSGKDKVFVPDFVISGTDGKKLYTGENVSTKSIVLNAGESKTVRFAIATDAAARLNGLVVMTPEQFASPMAGNGSGTIDFYVGHAVIGMPDNNQSPIGAAVYTLDTPITFDAQNELIDKDVQVSLVELHMHENQGDGYKTAIAKFKVQNTGKLPLPFPDFQADIASGEGYTYSGVRQNITTKSLMPGLSHVVSYSFNVPKSEDEESFVMRILDSATAAPYSTTIASIGVDVQDETLEDVWNLYPFEAKLNSWSLQSSIDTVPFTSYSYQLNLDMDIKRTADIFVDDGFSKLKIDIADGFGRMLGTETVPFVGVNRLISGKQTILFNNIRTEQLQYPLTINFYEVIDTPNGESTRLIETVKQ